MLEFIENVKRWYEDYKFESLTPKEKVALEVLRFLNKNHIDILKNNKTIILNQSNNFMYFTLNYNGINYRCCLNSIEFILETYNIQEQEGIRFNFVGLSFVKKNMFQTEFKKFVEKLRIINE